MSLNDSQLCPGNAGLTLTIVIPAAAVVVAGEEGVGEAKALTAGPGTS